MNPAPLEPRPWSRGRWWTLIALVFAAHVGLIFALGDRKPLAPRPPALAPVLRLATGPNELLALTDPTLFALPHPAGFAGAVWRWRPEVTVQPFRWTEPPRPLRLSAEKLGDRFAQFMQTNRLARFEPALAPAPETGPAVVPAFSPAALAPSTVRLGDGLAGRRWLNPPRLGAWPAPDLLTNCVVSVLVRPDGGVTSAKLLPPGSGSAEADQFALAAARTARFTPLTRGAAEPAVGTLIFEWQTLPMTNAPAPGP
jgi:TonB family protein